jgi:hypothetical protein
METARARYEEAKKDTNKLISELEVVHKAKTESEERLRALQGLAYGQGSSSAEVTDLKERLRHEVEELQSKTEQSAKLERAYSQLESSRADLQTLCEQQQSEISRYSSVVESLRQGSDKEQCAKEKQDRATIQLARNQMFTVEKEKADLQARLERAETNESISRNTQASLIAERNDLRNRHAEIKSAKEASKIQLLQMQEEKTEAVRIYEEELDALRRQHEHSDVALKEAEAKIQLQKAEHQKKIEYDRQKYESIVRTLMNDLNRVQAQIASSEGIKLKASQITTSPEMSSRSLQIIHAGKNRKKVNRENHSVLDVARLSGVRANTSAQHSATGTQESTHRHDGDFRYSDTLFDEVPQVNCDVAKLVSSHDLSIVDPAAEQVEDTQEPTEVLLFVDDAAKEASQDSLQGSKRQNEILTDQSSLSASLRSDEITQLYEEYQCSVGPKLLERDPNLIVQAPLHEHTKESPMQLENTQLYARPKSQANTASRMMPPPEDVLYNFNQRKLSPVTNSKTIARHRVPNNPRHKSKSIKEGSPDLGHQNSQISKHTHAERGLGLTRHDDKVHNTSRAPEQAPNQKRKDIREDNVRSKRQRTSSQSLPADSSSGSWSYSPHHPRSSSNGVGSRANLSPLQSQASPGVDIRSRGRLGSSDAAPRTNDRAPSSILVSSRSSAATRMPRRYGRQSRPSRHPTSSYHTRSRSELLPSLK